MKQQTVSTGIGVLFVTLGILIAVTAENGILSYLAALLVGSLGAEAIYRAARGQQSLLSRIGPLP